MTSDVTVTQAEAWECFQDSSYYDMWCVRQVGDRTFGSGFHLMRSEEATALRDLLNQRPDAQVEPVAWLHTLHMEQGQTIERLSDWDGVDEDEPSRTAFGLPGRDYSAEYPVTSTPLYTHPPAQDVAALVEALAELQLAAFLAGRGSIVTKADGRTRQSKPGPTMDDYRNMARAALAKHERNGQ